MNSSIPSRPLVDTSLRASKWRKCFVLIDSQEMEALLKVLGQFWILQVSGLIPIGQEIIDQKIFLEVYRQYIETLKKGELPTDQTLRSYFSSVFTTVLDALYTVSVNSTSRLVKIQAPVIQLQRHRFDYWWSYTYFLRQTCYRNKRRRKRSFN